MSERITIEKIRKTMRRVNPLLLQMLGIGFIGLGIILASYPYWDRNNELPNNNQIKLVVEEPTVATESVEEGDNIEIEDDKQGRIGEGISTSREEEGVAKPELDMTKWVANDYTKGDIDPEDYQVVWGDTLWEIAEGVYGDGQKWTVILANNENQIDCLSDGTQALIYPGQILII